MKNTLLVAIILCFLAHQNGIIAQENCSKYYPLQEGTSFEYTVYNKKDKVDGVSTHHISKVTTDGPTTTATFDTNLTDKKGKEIFNSSFNISCTTNGIKIDYASLVPSQMFKQYKDMGLEMDISGTDIQLPNDLSVGKELEDANVAITMNMSGIKMNISITQTNRKVVKKEQITTPAGTFECYLIDETLLSKTMGATQETTNSVWLAEGVGLVKQESYKKNGSLISKMALTKFSK